MIQLKLSFRRDEQEILYEIEKNELLSDAFDRILKDTPSGKSDKSEIFNTVVNGYLIDKDFRSKIKLTEKDNVLITPKIGGGESGQIFKQILIISAVATAAFFTANPFLLAGVAIGATLLFNALIPPPVPEIGGIGGYGDINSSQMYSITGQSNEAKRLGIVPKVYGSHRIFPNIAVNPYTELAVDPLNGETVQYLYCIYDFGLGTPQISELKIGDTPLTTDSFTDFDYRFVDPMKSSVTSDDFDNFLKNDFQYYSRKRTITAISPSLLDGDENIQFSDVNADDVSQEILLDFVCPNGLYGFSSSGTFGDRSIKLNIQFALVGTSDWKDYNDLNFVDSFHIVGGSDVTDFDSNFYPLESATYYETFNFTWGSYNTGINASGSYSVKRSQNKIIVPANTNWTIGSKVFYQKTRFLGIVESIVDHTTYYELTLDRIISNYINDVFAFQVHGYAAYNDSATFGAPFNIQKLRRSGHESGAAVITAKRNTPVYSQFRFTPKVPGQYQVRVKRVSTFGTFFTQKSDNLTWTTITTAFKSQPILTDKRHVFMELRIKATNQLNGNIQNLSGIATAVLPVYDPDTQIWTRQVTNNPAWVYCDLLTGEVNKKSVPVSRLELTSILEWADYCAEVPTPPSGQTYLEPRFQCNFILDYDATLQEVLQQVGSAAQASLNMIDGKYGVLLDKFKETPVQIFTPRNSRDFSSTRIYGPRPHGVHVKYIDPNLDWSVQELTVYDNGFDKTNATEFDDLTSFACTNYEQAWRFGRYMIAQNKLRQETINILVDFENLVCTRGDYVQITQDVMRVGGTPARVKNVVSNRITIDDSLDIDPDINYGYTYRVSTTGVINTSTLTPVTANEFDVDGDIPAIGDLIAIGEVGKIVFDCIIKAISPNDDLSATITLVEKADEIFDYESSNVLPDYDPQISETSDPTFKPPKAVIDLTLGDNFWECNVVQSGYNYFAEFVWNMPPGSVFEYFEIWVNDGRGYSLAGTTTAKYFKLNIDQSRLDNEHGFKVVAVSASGKKIHLIEMPEILFTPMEKTTASSDVDSLNMSITNQVLQLSWPSISDCDVAQYALRFSPDANDKWEASISLADVSKNVNSVSVQARTGVYMIKAIDYNGNQSANPALAITTIPNLFDLNIIETLNDAPTFGGTFDETELLGEAVILQEQVAGDVDTVQYYPTGYYTSENVLDIDDVYTVRLQSQIRADGYKFGELMSDWTELDLVDHLNTSTSDDWDVEVEYRATDVFAAMADWVRLDTVDHINYGAGVGFTDWRPIPTIGDATGRIFQFRIRLESLTPNVTPRLFDGTIKADMPDRVDSFENQLSSAADPTIITYEQVFKGPGTSPNVQISIDDAATGDYWSFDSKTLEGFSIRFYDKTNTQVVRQFDVVAKGFGHRHTSTI